MPGATPQSTTADPGTFRRVPRQARSRERVVRILDAAAEIVVERGVEAVTTRALAEATGVPVASIYQYFSADGVLLALVARDTDEMDRQLADDLAALTDPTPRSVVETTMRAFVSVYHRRPAFVEIYFRGRSNAAIRDFCREHNARIAATLKEYAEATGLLHLDDHVAQMAIEVGDRIFQLAFERSDEGDPALLEEGVALITSYLESLQARQAAEATTPTAAARAAVAGAARRLAEEGLLIGTAGNVSALVPDSELVAVTATGVELASCTPEQVTVVDRTGRVVEGTLAPTSELELHLAVYDAHDAAAVVHTHAPFATAVGLVREELPVVHYQQLLLGGEVRVAPYATFGSSELAAGVRQALQDRSAALMANHGAVSHGTTLEKAVDNALLLEWCCRIFHTAAALGAPAALDQEQQTAVVMAALSSGYGQTRPAEKTEES